jgi:FixJ family two-component response regulator
MRRYFFAVIKRARSKRSEKKRECSVQPLIAIVDDDKSVREALRSLFKSMGFQTALFARAQDFLESPDFSETACLILDVMMPGMDGLELQGQLAARRSIPIIFITGHADQNTCARALRAGAVSLLAKPFSEEVLLSALHSALEEGRGRAEGFL